MIAIDSEELLILLRILLHRVFEGRDDLLFDRIRDLLEHRRLLEHFPRDVEREIIAVDETLDELQIVRDQRFAFLLDEDPLRIEIESLLVILAIKVIGGMRRDIKKRIVENRSFDMKGNREERLLVIIEFALIEIVEHLRGDLFGVLLPKRDHRIEGLVLDHVIVFAFDRLAILIELRLGGGHIHLDRITDVVAVFLDQVLDGVALEVLIIILIVRVLLEVDRDDRAVALFFRIFDRVVLDAIAREEIGILLAGLLG